jgi:hypothetical protein
MDPDELTRLLLKLQEQVRHLTAVEAIHRLKYRYWRAVHEGKPDAIGACFSRNAEFDYGGPEPVIGREKITQFFANAITSDVRVILHGHNPEIEQVSELRATGRWQLDNIRVGASSAFRMGNGYVEEYLLEDGEWKVDKSKVQYLYLEPIKTAPLAGPNSFSASSD